MALGFDWQILTNVYKEAPVTPTFLDSLIKKENLLTLPKVKIRRELVSVKASKLKSLYSDPVQNAIDWNYEEVSLVPPEIWEQVDLTEEFLMSKNYNPMILEGTNANVVNSIQYAIAKAMKEIKDKVQTRIELMLADLLEDGKIYYKEGQFEYEVDYNVVKKQLTLSSSTEIVRVLKKHIQEMKSAGVVPDAILLSPTVADALYSNKDMKDYLSKSVYATSDIQLDTTAYGSVFAKLAGLPTMYEYYVEVSNEKYFDDNLIVLVDTSKIEKDFAAVVNANINKDMTPVVAKAVAFEYSPDLGNKVILNVISRPLPVVLTPNAIRVLQVTLG